MAQKVDLYTLLKTFSHKNYSPVIKTELFISFMEKNSQRENAAQLNIDDWKIDTRGKILRGLNELVIEHKVDVEGIGPEQKIILSSFFHEMIAKYYQSTEGTGNVPFLNEMTLRLRIPPEQCRLVSVESGLIDYLNEEHKNPTQIIKLVFPENYGTALTLEEQYPHKILELGLLKIEHALHVRSEMDYFQQKLNIRFKGQEVRVRNFLNLIMTRPAECIQQIEESSEFMYSIWLFLCPLITKYIEETVMRTNDRTPAQVALMQASSVVLALNNHYQILAINKRNIDMALGSVYEKMLEPPFIFNIAEILQLKNETGALLSQRYTEIDLENFLKEKLVIGAENKFPEILRFKTRDGIEWFIRKEKVWPLCVKLLADVQQQIKSEITQRWMKMIREFRREPAMDKDGEFEELVLRFCDLYSPQLLMIIQDKKLAVLQEEILHDKGSLPKNTRLFELDRALPLRTILGLRREDLIRNCKLSLPFWYSIKFLVRIIGVFKGGKKKKKQDDIFSKEKKEPESSLYASAEKLVRMLVPENSDIDNYLDSIRDRWNQLLDKTAQKRLTDDVHAIVKAHLNQVLKLQKPHTFDNQMLGENAEHVINMNAALQKITNKNALRLYIKVYITKLLLSKK